MYWPLPAATDTWLSRGQRLGAACNAAAANLAGKQLTIRRGM